MNLDEIARGPNDINIEQGEEEEKKERKDIQQADNNERKKSNVPQIVIQCPAKDRQSAPKETIVPMPVPVGLRYIQMSPD